MRHTCACSRSGANSLIMHRHRPLQTADIVTRGGVLVADAVLGGRDPAPTDAAGRVDGWWDWPSYKWHTRDIQVAYKWHAALFIPHLDPLVAAAHALFSPLPSSCGGLSSSRVLSPLFCPLFSLLFYAYISSPLLFSCPPPLSSSLLPVESTAVYTAPRAQVGSERSIGRPRPSSSSP